MGGAAWGKGGVGRVSGSYIQLEKVLAGFWSIVDEEVDDYVTCLPKL